MNKSLLILTLFLAIVACKENNKETEANTEVSVETPAYDMEGINQIVPDTVDGGEMLLGRIDRSGLEQDLFKESYEVSYSAHRMDSVRVDSIKPLLEGVEMTQKTFMSTLAKFKVEVVDPEGHPFDPDLHQAISMVEAPDAEPNTVLNVVQKGYRLRKHNVKAAHLLRCDKISIHLPSSRFKRTELWCPP